jgi:hypothetical protein
VILVSPGDAGKSTIARALAVSLASGLVVIPGMTPVGDPRPTLYVAGEDPVAYWHARSVESICRGLEITRSSLAQPIELFDASGRPLHRIVQAPLTFAAAWTFGSGDDPGTLTFSEAEPIRDDPEGGLSPELAKALAAYRDGKTTPAPLAKELGINLNTAKSRLRLLKEKGLIKDGSQGV